MLKPNQIRDYKFDAAGKHAYKAADVDEFIDEVYDSYETMFRENGELVKKLNLVADKLQTYKADEDNIRNALLNAERIKESTLAEAESKANDIIAAAEAKAKKVEEEANEKAADALREAQAGAKALLEKAQEVYDEKIGTIPEEIEKEKAHLLSIKEESVKVREDLIDSYKKQIAILEYTPDFSEEVKAAKAAAAIEEVEEEAEEEVETFADLEAEEEEPEVEIEILTDEEDDEEESDIDEYLDEDDDEDFEDIDSGDDLFADDDDDEKEISLF